MSVMAAWYCGGTGDAARGPVDRGVSLWRAFVAVRPEARAGVSCRRFARIRFPGMSICLASCSWWCVRMLEFAWEGAKGVGAWPVENRKR